jgi:co-chaperonin GroES (HSP10)
MKNEAGLVLTGVRVLVRIPELEKTVGSIVLATSTVEKEERAQTSSVLVDAADEAWNAKEMKGLQIGDTIFFARYAGAGCEFKKNGVQFRVMNAADIIGKLEEPLDATFKAAATTAETFGIDKTGSEQRYGT